MRGFRTPARPVDRIRKDILASSDPVGTIAYRWGISHLNRYAERPPTTAPRK
ncbi:MULTISPECIES: hypothetical protein [Streptomyces]|uniref:hypothetical protein n=1 Tax=Streptomyces TaxID=1883 RepID=UPI000B00BF0A|nr:MULTISPECIES: hypothetical protein [Streptomyces]